MHPRGTTSHPGLLYFSLSVKRGAWLQRDAKSRVLRVSPVVTGRAWAGEGKVGHPGWEVPLTTGLGSGTGVPDGRLSLGCTNSLPQVLVYPRCTNSRPGVPEASHPSTSDSQGRGPEAAPTWRAAHDTSRFGLAVGEDTEVPAGSEGTSLCHCGEWPHADLGRGHGCRRWRGRGQAWWGLRRGEGPCTQPARA